MADASTYVQPAMYKRQDQFHRLHQQTGTDQRKDGSGSMEVWSCFLASSVSNLHSIRSETMTTLSRLLRTQRGHNIGQRMDWHGVRADSHEGQQHVCWQMSPRNTVCPAALT